MDCDKCTSMHPCWNHSRNLTGCRADKKKWAPSRCNDCIKAVAKMYNASREEKADVIRDFDPFIQSLRRFVIRVSALLVFSQVHPVLSFSVSIATER